MYEITIETPKGNIRFNLESLKELDKYLIKYPDFTGVRAKRKVKTNGKQNNYRKE